jgi:molybdate transport system substrate-binding protein
MPVECLSLARNKERFEMTRIIIVFLITAIMSSMGFQIPAYAEKIDPPWGPSPQGGKNFTVPGIDNVPDLHGEIVNPQLVIFFAGNQFMVVPDIMKAFRTDYPQYKRIYVETLPPGILADQIETEALIVGNLKITVRPDIYTAGKGKVEEIQREKHWFDKTVDYTRNRLAIMVYRGNPKGISSLRDLGKPDIRVSMPNPHWEGIAEVIIKAYEKSGGERLVNSVMKTKVKAGTAFLTHIHHRQTPIRIMEKKSDAGPVWFTEAYFQKMIGNPIDLVEIPEGENITVTYSAAKMKNALHRQAASDFLKFLQSEKGQKIYKKYGFLPVQ